MASTAVLVDDTGFMRTHLRSIIESCEYEVVGEGSDGNEAVALYKRYKPALMTMDIIMPNKNGIDAVREILDFDQEARMIMVSAMGQKAKVIEQVCLFMWCLLPFNMVVCFLRSFKKMARVDSVTGLLVKSFIVIPIALIYLVSLPRAEVGAFGAISPNIILVLIGAGAATAIVFSNL